MTTRVGLNHRENKGVGYTTLDVFIVPSFPNRVTCFFDGRGRVLNDGKFASNLGIGLRVAALEKFAVGLDSVVKYSALFLIFLWKASVLPCFKSPLGALSIERLEVSS